MPHPTIEDGRPRLAEPAGPHRPAPDHPYARFYRRPPRTIAEDGRLPEASNSGSYL
jgi:hypothetical protein